jgi:hypothetical protein
MGWKHVAGFALGHRGGYYPCPAVDRPACAKLGGLAGLLRHGRGFLGMACTQVNPLGAS